MTKQEAAVVGAYTGYLLGDFADMHAYIEKKMGRPVFTHEMASEKFMDALREKTKADFVALKVE